MKLTAVYLAAGISSRFGGRIKALTRVGPNNETLLEISMSQAKKAGFNSFVIVTSHKTLNPLKDFFKDSFQKIKISYCIQETPEYREKPFGTAHATLSAKELINGPFIVLNSDDIYGENTLKVIADYLKKSKDAYCLPGYKLINVLSEKGGVNRGLIKTDKNGVVESIEEKFNITIKDIPLKYKADDLFSMNLFGMQKDFIDFLDKDFKKFLEENKEDPKIEWLLPETITKFKSLYHKKIAVLPTPDKWIVLTYPEDEPEVIDRLKKI